MTAAAAVQAFISKWEQNTQKESAAAKEHFAELCRLLGVPTPNDPGSGPDIYCFEKSLTKTGGKAGFADVWKRDCFAWEYKGKKNSATLDAAYAQLLLYKEDLGNPPVLVICDIANYEVHIAFTGYPTKVHRFTNADLQNSSTRELLRQVFINPEPLRPVERTETITEKVAGRFADVAQFLERRRFASMQIASFFMKVLFALFAEDIKLLPAELMSNSLKQSIRTPEEFPERARALFRAMREGGYFGLDRVPQFDGWLFADDEVLPLNADELHFLSDAARQDWSAVEPAIFGTLFERSLDPSKRAQLGAHYTSRSDILLIVEPVLMAPLRREWEHVKAGIEALRGQWEVAGVSVNRQRQLQSVAEGMLLDFMEQLAQVRVLDAACGSGNFLYVALNELKNLEKEVWAYAGGVGVRQPELGVSPAQLFGIEKNQFAAELAQVVVWIGYLQWLKVNGFLEDKPKEPILQNLHNIECRDAILTVDLDGKPAEPPWPEADVIIGNPPFLGGNKIRKELGDQYVEPLFSLYEGRVPASADLVCYWFERAREQIAEDKAQRVGLLATQGIRGGANRRVLERIKDTGNIFWAQSDRDWVLDAAVVHVSMVGFDDGSEAVYALDNMVVQSINPDLTAHANISQAIPLVENRDLCFRTDEKGGPFDIDDRVAKQMLLATNASGLNNSDVVRPYMNALDLTRRSRNMWVIDFGCDASEAAAAKYEAPFEYVQRTVKPFRETVRNPRERTLWWLHRRPAPDMRKAVAPLHRYIATPAVAKHRLFVWLDAKTIPDHQLYAVAREDDYFLGVLHSHLHELWARTAGTQLREAESGARYTPTTTFETFPFPWPPSKEDQNDPHVQTIAEAARELVRLRDEWLAGNGLPDLPLDKRTLTNLYNRRPDWLDHAHRRLDAAVFDAYGWVHDLTDDEILARLLALNLERAAGQGAVAAVAAAEDNADEE